MHFGDEVVSVFYTLFDVAVINVSLFCLLIPPVLTRVKHVGSLLMACLAGNTCDSNAIPPALSRFVRGRVSLRTLGHVLDRRGVVGAVGRAIPGL